MTTALSLLGLPKTAAPTINAKPTAGLPPFGQRIADFDTWRPGYGGMVVEVIEAGTNNTLAALYYDIGLTQPAPNPQALITETDANGNTYGKWAQPVYTAVPFQLYINSTDSTGIEYPPLIALPGEDASGSLVETARGQYPITLASFADSTVTAVLFGQLSSTAGTAANTQTLVAAIGAAGAQGGGEVLLPAGTIPFTSLSLPQGVVLVGDSLNGTTLQSSQTGAVVTLGGDGAGLKDLTLDGLDVVAASIGVFGLDIAEPVFENVVVRRFDTGIMLKGASAAQWRNLSVENCNTGADLRGDADLTGTNEGAELANIEWDGGGIALNNNFGARFRFIDHPAREIVLRNVGLSSNVGPALALHGVRGFKTDHCYWISNINNLLIEDDTNPLYQSLNTTSRIAFTGGQINAGTLNFNQSCVNVSFEKVELKGVSYNLTIPSNVILLLDCIEDSACTTTGDATKIARWYHSDDQIVTGITTGNTATVAWQYAMAPGKVGLFEAEVIGRRRDGTDYGIFWVAAGALQPAASLPYSIETTPFTAGAVLTGQTSGASARIVVVSATGSAGTLSIRDIVGTFISGEAITDSSGGSARMNGSMSTSATALDGGGTTVIRAAQPSGTSWTVQFGVSGSLIQLAVQGASGQTVEWTAKVRKTVP